jgi:hypothetical protein
MGKPKGKRPLGRPRRRLVETINMNLREIGWDGMDWIDLTKDRDQWKALVNTVMDFWVPQNSEKFLSSCTTGGFSRMGQLQLFVMGISVLNERPETPSRELTETKVLACVQFQALVIIRMPHYALNPLCQTS